MRTNVDIEETLVKKAKKISGIKTKRALIEYALNLVINLDQQARIRKYRGKLKWSGNLKKMRED